MTVHSCDTDLIKTRFEGWVSAILNSGRSGDIGVTGNFLLKVDVGDSLRASTVSVYPSCKTSSKGITDD